MMCAIFFITIGAFTLTQIFLGLAMSQLAELANGMSDSERRSPKVRI